MKRKQPSNSLTIPERQALVKQWDRLPGWCLARLQSNPMVLKLAPEDAIQAGYVGLCIAAERFDPSRGFKFPTYAIHWVFQAIRCQARDTSTLVRVPVWDPKLAEQYPDRFKKVKAAMDSTFDLYVHGINGDRDYIDELGEDQSHRQNVRDEAAELREVMKTLPWRYQRLLWDRAEGMTLQAIAEREKVSRERARQLTDKAMAMLRRKMGVTCGEA